MPRLHQLAEGILFALLLLAVTLGVVALAVLLRFAR